jgi:Rps23 Pro-64 3,4-dihydroxylase Tpa1-like proline 4-hydroxylase
VSIATWVSQLRTGVTRASYLGARPYPHAVFDDFLPAELAQGALVTFPGLADPVWAEGGRHYLSEGNADKFEMPRTELMPAPLRAIVERLENPEFIAFLSDITGASDLRFDRQLHGGGLNLAAPGSFLRAHADFNFSNELQSYRVLNLLLYFNPGWTEPDGGNLELWDGAQKVIVKRIAPAFNRAVLFTTHSNSVHGYDRIVAQPASGTRRSLNLYYYSSQPLDETHASPHKTLWREDWR